MKALEQEVVRLREVETRLAWDKEGLQRRIGALERTLTLHDIPLPTITPRKYSPDPGGPYPGQTAHVTLSNDEFAGQRLQINMDSSAPNIPLDFNQGATASTTGSGALESSHINGRDKSEREGNVDLTTVIQCSLKACMSPRF